MKIVFDIPVVKLPTFFLLCKEIGLTGEGVHFFLTSLDFHGRTQIYLNQPNAAAVHSRNTTMPTGEEISDSEVRSMIFNDGDIENSTLKTWIRYEYNILCLSLPLSCCRDMLVFYQKP